MFPDGEAVQLSMKEEKFTLQIPPRQDLWSPELLWLSLLGISIYFVLLNPLFDSLRQQLSQARLASELEFLSSADISTAASARRLLIKARRVTPRIRKLQVPEAAAFIRNLDRLRSALHLGSYQPASQDDVRAALRGLQIRQLRLTRASLLNSESLAKRSAIAVAGGLILFLTLAVVLRMRRRRRESMCSSVLGKEELGRMLFDLSPEAVSVADENDRIIAVNPAYCQASGYSADELLGQHIDYIRSGQQDDAYLADIKQTVEVAGRWTGELWQRRKSGEAYAEKVSVVRLLDARKRCLGNMYVSMDITASKESQKMMVWQSNHDHLTKLPNRTMFEERVGRLALESREFSVSAAILSIDLDRFSRVNDSIGHGSGDRLLIEAAHRLSMCVKDTDTVARLSNDEYALMIVGVVDDKEAERTARQIIEEIQKPFLLAHKEIFVTASVGVSMLPQDGDDCRTLMQRAHSAMARAKEAGGNSVVFYQPAMNERAERRLEIETQLRGALENDQLELYFQPIVNQRTRKVKGAEALLRWHHPQWGSVSPAEFIPVAEETGLIVEIGLWVVQQVASQVLLWQQAGLDHLRVSLNLSGRQLQDPADLKHLVSLLEDAPITQMTLEITESVLMDNTEAVLGFLQTVQGYGAKIALDDFGTGFSSLSYLRQYHFDVLKIDKCFIDDLEYSNKDLGLVASIVSMGRILGVDIVAEGVETVAQLEYLKQIGCDLIQGYYFSRPLPLAEFEKFVGDNQMEFVEERLTRF